MARLPNKKKIEAKKKKKKVKDAPENGLLDKPAIKDVKAKQIVVQRAKTTGSNQPKFISKSVQFLREVKAELKKVTWPSQKQTMASTAVVIVLVFIISFFLGISDICLSGLAKFIY